MSLDSSRPYNVCCRTNGFAWFDGDGDDGVCSNCDYAQYNALQIMTSGNTVGQMSACYLPLVLCLQFFFLFSFVYIVQS